MGQGTIIRPIMEKAMESKHAFLIEDDDAQPDIFAFVELLSAIPSKERKRRKDGIRLSRKCGDKDPLEKFLSHICDYSGRLAESVFGRPGRKCLKSKK